MKAQLLNNPLSTPRDTRIHELEEENAQMAKALRWFVVQPNCRPHNGDWACAECKPYSHMLQDGFQCAFHRSISILEARIQRMEAKNDNR